MTPPKTRAYENLVRHVALAARSRERGWRIDAPAYSVTMTFYRSTQRGDLDNLVKSVLDACNGVLWVDDSRVTHFEAQIVETTKGDERAVVAVEMVVA